MTTLYQSQIPFKLSLQHLQSGITFVYYRSVTDYIQYDETKFKML